MARTTAGLIHKSDGTLAGWTASAGWSSVATPSYSVFDPLPIAGVGSDGNRDDAMGVREVMYYFENGVWYQIYDACSYERDHWAIFLASSTDRGLTWTRRGVIGSDNLRPSDNGRWTFMANEWFEKRGSTYYLHKASSAGSKNHFGPTSYPLGGGIDPIGIWPPYLWEIWTTTDFVNGPWTRAATVDPRPGGWAKTNVNINSLALSNGIYYATVNADAPYTEGLMTATAPLGPYTEFGPVDGMYKDYRNDPRQAGFGMEGGALFFDPTFGKWLLGTNPFKPPGKCVRTALLISDSISDWSAATLLHIQKVCPMDSFNSIGEPRHITGPEGALIYDATTGIIPITFDADPTGFGVETGDAVGGWHIGRRCKVAMLEPSAACLRVAGSSDTSARRISRTLTQADFSLEFTYQITSDKSGNIVLEYRSDGGPNSYRLQMTNATASLYKMVNGAGNLVASASSPTEALKYTGPFAHRIQLLVQGNRHTLKINGEVQFTATDSAIASGSILALESTGWDADLRSLSIRTGNTVTIQGLQPGSSAVVRAACGLPAAVVAADAGGTATFTHAHYPMTSVDINGTDYTPAGGIWGGDVLQFSGLPGQRAINRARIR